MLMSKKQLVNGQVLFSFTAAPAIMPGSEHTI
ncbi:MAG: hypothetical protein ACD_60C00028G0068 [uncultured bacterium]|nr:MAG: hypothetical protein ACD_60C00028G0068 [uncultured bacterium]